MYVRCLSLPPTISNQGQFAAVEWHLFAAEILFVSHALEEINFPYVWSIKKCTEH